MLSRLTHAHDAHYVTAHVGLTDWLVILRDARYVYDGKGARVGDIVDICHLDAGGNDLNQEISKQIGNLALEKRCIDANDRVASKESLLRPKSNLLDMARIVDLINANVEPIAHGALSARHA